MKHKTDSELYALFCQGFRDTRDGTYPRPQLRGELLYRYGAASAPRRGNQAAMSEEDACADFAAWMGIELGERLKAGGEL